MKKISLFAVAFVSLGLLASCGGNTNSNKPTDNTSTTEPATVEKATKAEVLQLYVDYFFSKQGLATIRSNGGMFSSDIVTKAANFDATQYPVLKKDASAVTIRVKGSTSVMKITDAMASSVKELFKQGQPTFNKDGQTGSGTAVAGLKDGSADVGFLSKEVAGGDQTDLDSINGKKTHFAIDAVVPIVNKASNKLTAITKEQLQLIYAGSDYYKEGKLLAGKTPITNWNQISDSGLNSAIKVYSRDHTSGTRECFTEKIGIKDAKNENTDDKKVIVEYTKAQENGDMLSAISKDANGIGYASFDSLASVKDKVQGLSVDGVEPTEATILGGQFSLQRYFNMVVGKDVNLPAVTAEFNK